MASPTKQKQITLRDYLNLHNFKSKPKEHEISSPLTRRTSPGITSHRTESQTSLGNRTKRKVEPSNKEIL